MSPQWFIPVKAPVWKPNLQMLDDDGLRGSMVDVYDQIAGQRYDSLSFDCDVYADSFPALVRGCLGSTDTVTGTTAPYTHTIGLLNNTLSSQPPSYTGNYFDGADINQLAAAQLGDLVIKFNAAGLLTVTTNYISNPSTVITTTTNTPTTLEAIASWNCVVKLGGTAITKLVEGELDLKRGTKAIPAITGTQTMYQNWSGPLSTKGSKLVVIMESDAELTYFLNNSKGIALDLLFTDPGLNTVDFHMSTTAWAAGSKNNGKDWLEVDLEFFGLPNSTDIVAGGLSPIKVAITNAVSAAY